MIHEHRWNPPGGAPPRPHGIYLLHGMSEHGARYAPLAERLAAEGWRVGAHDHPGHGRSGGRRGVAEPADALVSTAASQLETFAAETDATPILFGHSLGGVVAIELVLARHVPVAGLMLSAPAIVPRLAMKDRLLLRVLSALAPGHAVERAYDGSLLTHDAAIIAAAEADPLIHGFKSAGLVGWLMAASRRAIDAADALDVDTLLLVAGDDALIDIERTRAFAERIPAARLTRHLYEGYRHEILNETPERRERVVADILSWLESRDSGRRTGSLSPAPRTASSSP